MLSQVRYRGGQACLEVLWGCILGKVENVYDGRNPILDVQACSLRLMIGSMSSPITRIISTGILEAAPPG